MEMQDVLAKIEQQQKQTKKSSPAWCVGEQLKDIVRTASREVVEIIGADLENKGMGIADCEKKIADFASKNRNGIVGFCGPEDADRIIREFYGIKGEAAALNPAQQPSAKRRAINIADFM